MRATTDRKGLATKFFRPKPDQKLQPALACEAHFCRLNDFGLVQNRSGRRFWPIFNLENRRPRKSRSIFLDFDLFDLVRAKIPTSLGQNQDSFESWIWPREVGILAKDEPNSPILTIFRICKNSRKFRIFKQIRPIPRKRDGNDIFTAKNLPQILVPTKMSLPSLFRQIAHF